MTQYVNSGTAGPIQAGATAAILGGEPLVQEIRERIKTGLDLAYDTLERIQGIVLPTKPKGGMYAFFALEGEDDASRVCADILEKARVGLAPGHLFGSSSSAFLRMCVCRDRGQIATALDRMLTMMN
jgi:aspartate/methionine/tyrosine aminotransferase